MANDKKITNLPRLLVVDETAIQRFLPGPATS